MSEAITTISPLEFRLREEMDRQDAKHGTFNHQGSTVLGRSRLAIACLEDEVEEVKTAWRLERSATSWDRTREEVLQVAALAMRTLRDAL